MEDLKSEDIIHRSCVGKEQVEIKRTDLDKLTGFLKQGSSSSYHYLGHTGSKKLKAQIRKLVLKKLLQKRHDYLGVYAETRSAMSEIHQCAQRLDIAEFDRPNFDIGMTDKRNVFSESLVKASIILESYLRYKYNLDKEIKNYNSFIKKLKSDPTVHFNKSPKERTIALKSKILEYLSQTDDALIKKLGIDYIAELEASECDVINKSASNIRRLKNTKTNTYTSKNGKSRVKVKKYNCRNYKGDILDEDYFLKKQEEAVAKKFLPMLKLAEKYPMLAKPENMFTMFSKNKMVGKTRLMSKIIGDIGENQTNNRSQFFKTQLNDLVSSITKNSKEKFNELAEAPEYKENLKKLLSDSSYAAIFNRTDDRYLNGGKNTSYLKPAIQEYVNKLDDSILTFCNDNGLEFDYHNHKGLVEEVLKDPQNIDGFDMLSPKNSLMASQIAYCYLLDNEPPKEGGLSTSGIAGFGLLAAGGVSTVLPIPGARIAAGLSFTAAGALFTGDLIFNMIDNGAQIDQNEGYLAIGIGDILKLHNLQSSQNTNKAFLAADIALLSFNAGMIKNLVKLKKASSEKKKLARTPGMKKNDDPNYDIVKRLNMENMPESIIVRNNSLNEIDLKALGESDKLSLYTFDAFHEGHYVPEVVKAVLKAKKSQMQLINESIEKALVGADPKRIEEIDVFVEFALTQKKSKALKLLTHTDSFFKKIDTGSKTFKSSQRRAKRELDRYQEIKDRKKQTKTIHLSSREAFDEHSEWLKCKSPRYAIKRNQGYQAFLASLPRTEMVVIPTSAVVSNGVNYLKGDEIQTPKEFLKTTLTEMLFVHFYARHIFKGVLSPMLNQAKNIKNEFASIGAQASSFFAVGYKNGMVKGFIFDQINKLPLDQKNETIEYFNSPEFQAQLHSVENEIKNSYSMNDTEIANKLDMESPKDIELFRQEAMKVLSGEVEKPTADSSASKMAIADGSFAFANSFKIVAVANMLTPYFCMANSDKLSEAVRKRYKMKGSALYFAQSIATVTAYFQYRDYVMENL